MTDKAYDPNPSSEANNSHHSGGYRSEEEMYEDYFGKGIADPDFRGYPAEKGENCEED
jgi:hypothetical protein